MACSAFIFAYGFLMNRFDDAFFARWWFVALLIAATAWAAATVAEPRWSTKTYALALHSIAAGWDFAVLLAVFIYRVATCLA